MRTRAALVPQLVWSSGSITATANSGAKKLPLADAYAWIFDVSAESGGTTPTLDIAIQISPDDGTTWYSVSRLAQITTAATKSMKVHGNGPIQGQAAAVTAIADTGGALESNFPLTNSVRILATVGGTNPTYPSIKVYIIPIYQQGRQQ